jgi:hypothetical protein
MDLGLFDFGDGVRATTPVRYVEYRVGMVPRDETLSLISAAIVIMMARG